MTKQSHASQLWFDVQVSMTVLLLVAFGTAALAVAAAWGESSFSAFASLRGFDTPMMELEPSALFAQGPEP